MRHAHTLLAMFALPVLVPLAAAAQTPPPIRAGLWEITPGPTLLNGQPMPGMADMSAQLAQLPPAMRAQMEEQMRKQGVQMGGGAAKHCVSAEMLKRSDWGQPAQGRCTMTVTERSGPTWRWKAVCSEPPSEGEGSTSFSGERSYRSEVRWTLQRGGKPQLMQTSADARWLSADCQGLAPLAR